LGPPALKQQLAGIMRECSMYFLEHVGNEHGGGGGRDTGVGDSNSTLELELYIRVLMAILNSKMLG